MVYSALGFESVSPFCFRLLTQTRVLVRWLEFFWPFFVCKSGKELLCCAMYLSRFIGFKLFHFVYPRLLTQTRVLVSMREVFLGLFIFGEVGKNFCIRYVSLGLMVSSFFTCWCR